MAPSQNVLISIQNNGDEPLEVSSIDLVDNNAAGSLIACGDWFTLSLSGNTSGTIAPQDSMSVTLTGTFTGTESGLCGIADASNSVTINSNDPNNPAYTLQVGGTVLVF